MKFTVNKSKLIKASGKAARTVSSKTSLLILTGIKLEVTKEGILFTGSDSELTVQEFLPAGDDVVIERTGSIVLNSKYFNEMIKKLSGDNITVEVDEFLAKISAGKAEFKLNALDAEEYPKIQGVDNESTLTLPAEQLTKIINQTIFACSTSETRPILRGACWTVENGELTVIATDSHRLSKIVEKIEDSTFTGKVVIPSVTLDKVAGLMEGKTVQISFNEHQAVFKSENTVVYSRLLDGVYPDTSRLIPTEHSTEVTLKLEDFKNILDRAGALLANEKNKIVRLFIEDSQAVISSQLKEMGSLEEEVPLESLKGDALTISFSQKYAMDALKALSSKDVIVNFTGAMRPFIIKPTDESNITQLVLPVRTA